MFTKISFLFLLTSIAVSILFFVPGFGDGFELPKISLILPLLWMSTALLVIDEKYIPLIRSFPKKWNILFGSMVLVELISLIFATHPRSSFLGIYPRYQGFLLHATLLASIPTLIFHFRQRINRHTFITTYICAAILAATIGLITFIIPQSILDPIRYESRLFSTLGNPNVAALVFLIALIFTTLFNMRRYTFILLFLLFSISIYLTGSRSVFVLYLCTIAYSIYKHTTHKTYYLLSLFAIAFFIIFFGQTRMSTIQDNSFSSRIVLWQIGISELQDTPLTGYGQDAVQEVFSSYTLPTVTNNDPAVLVDRAHNIILDTWISIGIIGLLIYAFVVIQFFLISKKELLLMSSILLTYVLVHFVSINVQLLLCFIVASTYAQNHSSKRENML